MGRRRGDEPDLEVVELGDPGRSPGPLGDDELAGNKSVRRRSVRQRAFVGIAVVVVVSAIAVANVTLSSSDDAGSPSATIDLGVADPAVEDASNTQEGSTEIRVWPPMLLGEPSGVRVAFVDGWNSISRVGTAHVLDLDTGLERPLESRRGEGVSAYAISPLADGWLVAFESGDEWFPGDGDRIDVWTTQVYFDTATSTAFAFHGSGGSGVIVERFDGETGESVDALFRKLLEPTRTDPPVGVPVFLDPVGAVGDGVLLQAPPGLYQRSPDLIWLDPESGEQRTISPPAPGAEMIIAEAGHIVWQHGGATCEVLSCPIVVTDTNGSAQATIHDAHSEARAAVSRDGLYIAVSEAGDTDAAIVVDLNTGERREVEATRIVREVAWSDSGWLVIGLASGGEELEVAAVAPDETRVRHIPGLAIPGDLAAQ